MSATALRPWNGTTVRTRLFDGISLLLPAAEDFLIATMAQCLAQAGGCLDETTRAEVQRFVREEGAHRKVHERYNEALVSATPAARPIAVRAGRAAAELAPLALSMKLALAAAFEYLTSVLSYEMLAHPVLLAAEPSPQGRIWRWHAREELAHSHVAMDVARQVGVGGPRRLLAYVLATAWLAFDVLRFWLALCRCERAAGVGGLVLGREAGAFAIRCIPSMLRMAVGWARYFLPGTRRFMPR
jgi:predicted metal-dependent hydrolase